MIIEAFFALFAFFRSFLSLPLCCCCCSFCSWCVVSLARNTLHPSIYPIVWLEMETYAAASWSASWWRWWRYIQD